MYLIVEGLLSQEGTRCHMAWGRGSHPASAHLCLLSFSFQRSPDLARVSGDSVSSHTDIVPCIGVPLFPQDPTAPSKARLRGSAEPLGPASTGRGHRRAGRGSSGSRSTGLSQRKCLVTLGAPSQDLRGQTFGGPSHLSHLQGAWQSWPALLRDEKRSPGDRQGFF